MNAREPRLVAVKKLGARASAATKAAATATLAAIAASFNLVPMTVIARLWQNPLVKRLTGRYYPLITRFLGDDEMLFMNWAYEEDPPMALPLESNDEPNRESIQLYYRTATQADLGGKQVLEVSCGHGGGASYLMRTLHPESYTGLDLNADGIEFCRRRHNLAGLDFVQGDAEKLPFADQSFDAVLNVEASHCYPHFPRFLDEVARVLRPGGDFLYADVRPRGAVVAWEADLANASMRLISDREINAEVLRGMESSTQQSQELIARMPRFLQGVGREFAGMEGSRFHRALQKGEFSYRMCSFAKD